MVLFRAAMSDVVEKTLSALPGLLSLDSQPGASKLSPTSKLGHLVRNITELTSKNVSVYHHVSFSDTDTDTVPYLLLINSLLD